MTKRVVDWRVIRDEQGFPLAFHEECGTRLHRGLKAACADSIQQNVIYDLVYSRWTDEDFPGITRVRGRVVRTVHVQVNEMKVVERAVGRVPEMSKPNLFPPTISRSWTSQYC